MTTCARCGKQCFANATRDGQAVSSCCNAQIVVGDDGQGCRHYFPPGMMTGANYGVSTLPRTGNCVSGIPRRGDGKLTCNMCGSVDLFPMMVHYRNDPVEGGIKLYACKSCGSVRVNPIDIK